MNFTKIINEIKKGTVVVEVEPGIFHATSATSDYVIVYDENKCIGAASCAAIAPLTFFMNDENRAEVSDANGNEVVEMEDGAKYSEDNVFDDDETILQGAMSCPVLAIEIFNKLTGEKIFPVE